MPPQLRKLLIPLGSLVLLSACAKTQQPALIATDKLCESWEHRTIRKADKLTEETAAGIEGGNKARPAWGCEYGANRAKVPGHG